MQNSLEMKFQNCAILSRNALGCSLILIHRPSVDWESVTWHTHTHTHTHVQ